MILKQCNTERLTDNNHETSDQTIGTCPTSSESTNTQKLHYNGYHLAKKGNKEDRKHLEAHTIHNDLATAGTSWDQIEEITAPIEMNRKNLLPDVHAMNGDDDNDDDSKR